MKRVSLIVSLIVVTFVTAGVLTSHVQINAYDDGPGPLSVNKTL